MKLENLAAIKTKEDSQQTIGYLTWYSVAAREYEKDEIMGALQNAGLSEYAPNPIRVPDAFRRATKAVEVKREQVADTAYRNILVREVAADKKIVQRNLVIEIVDPAGRRLSYNPEGAIIILNRENETVQFSVLDESVRPYAEEAARLFEVFRTHYDDQTVRRIVQSVLQKLAPTPIRPSGGVYFVPRAHGVKLEALVSFLRALEGCEGYKLPLIDLRETRDMVRAKLMEHMRATIDALKQALASEGINKNTIKAQVTEAKQLLDGLKAYEELLNEEMERIHLMADIMRQQVDALIDRLIEKQATA